MRRRNTGFCCHTASVKRRSPRAGVTSLRPTAAQQLGESAHRGGGCGARLDGDALAEPANEATTCSRVSPTNGLAPRIGGSSRSNVVCGACSVCSVCFELIGARAFRGSGDWSGWWPRSLIRS